MVSWFGRFPGNNPFQRKLRKGLSTYMIPNAPSLRSIAAAFPPKKVLGSSNP